MNCEQFHEELDGLNSAHQELHQNLLSAKAHQHIEECQACQSLWKAEIQLSAVISAWRNGSSVPHDSRQPMKLPASGSSTPRHKGSRSITRWSLSAIAACIALSALFVRSPITVEVIVSTVNSHQPPTSASPVWITAVTLSVSQFSARPTMDQAGQSESLAKSVSVDKSILATESESVELVTQAGSHSRPDLTSYFTLAKPSLPLAKLRQPVEAWNHRLQQKHHGPVLETVGGLYVPVPAPPIEQWQQVAVTVAPMSQSLAEAITVLCSPFQRLETEPLDVPGAMNLPPSRFDFCPRLPGNHLIPVKIPCSEWA